MQHKTALQRLFTLFEHFLLTAVVPVFLVLHGITFILVILDIFFQFTLGSRAVSENDPFFMPFTLWAVGQLEYAMTGDGEFDPLPL